MESGKQDLIICSPELGISPESNLGGEVHDREMLKALDDLGVQTLVILPFGKKHPIFKNAKIYYLPTPIVYPPWLFNIFILPYLFLFYFKYKFNILRVHSPMFVGFGAVFFRFFLPRVKLVATYHHIDSDFDKVLIDKFDLVTTVSEETRKQIGRGVVIPNGVDIKYKPQTKNKKLVDKYNIKNKKVLLYLGQLIPRKNIPFLFDVIKALPKDYVLMICGDGKLSVSVPEGVIVTGKISEEEKVDYYNLADVFVYPSLKEGFGLSVAEALACGKAVVASNVPIVKNTPLDTKKWVKEILDQKPSNHVMLFSWKESAKKLLFELQKINVA